MTAVSTPATADRTALQQRVDAFAGDVIARVNSAIVDHRMTYEEYDAAKQWLIRLGEAGEWPLFLDVWVEHTVEELAAHSRHGSAGTILGPFHLEGSPALAATAALPMRDDEPGDRLVLRGQVRDLDGAPVAGATLDVWQSDASGSYSGFMPGPPQGNLRGKFTTGDDGRFAITTVVPGPYTIPLDGPCGQLCQAAGWSPWRPARPDRRGDARPHRHAALRGGGSQRPLRRPPCPGGTLAATERVTAHRQHVEDAPAAPTHCRAPAPGAGRRGATT